MKTNIKSVTVKCTNVLLHRFSTGSGIQIRNLSNKNICEVFFGGGRTWKLLTAHVGVVDDGFAPRAAAVVLVGAHTKLIRCVGFQVVDDCVTSRACLVNPLPVPLPVADGVKPKGEQKSL